MQSRTKYNVTLALLTAIAFLLGYFIRVRGIIPGAPFLTYDAKDVGILIGGFLYGPMAALIMSVVLALIEMVTISDSGPIGAVMNAIASASFTCTAAVVYSRMRSIKGAVFGLLLGMIAATVTMLLWNYIMIPLYQPWITREMVQGLILPALLPFNLIKTGLNAAAAMILYKHVASALRAARLYAPASPDAAKGSLKQSIAVFLVSGFVIFTIVMVIILILL